MQYNFLCDFTSFIEYSSIFLLVMILSVSLMMFHSNREG